MYHTGPPAGDVAETIDGYPFLSTIVLPVASDQGAVDCADECNGLPVLVSSLAWHPGATEAWRRFP